MSSAPRSSWSEVPPRGTGGSATRTSPYLSSRRLWASFLTRMPPPRASARGLELSRRAAAVSGSGAENPSDGVARRQRLGDVAQVHVELALVDAVAIHGPHLLARVQVEQEHVA